MKRGKSAVLLVASVGTIFTIAPFLVIQQIALFRANKR